MEHLNRECKGTIGSLGPTVSLVNMVAQIGMSVGELMKITTQYDSISKLNLESGKHSKPSTASDPIRRFLVTVSKKTQSLSQLFSSLE